MNKIKEFFQVIITIEEKLGIRRFIEYTTFTLIVIGILNFQNIVKSAMDIQERISKEEHQRKLRLRDELMEELPPLLVELRTKANADRVLYFEYHNSTENFIGIPFKYASLVAVSQEYGARGFDQSKFKEVNSGLFGGIYTDLCKDGIVMNTHGIVCLKYPEIHDFFALNDGSNRHVFINIPGFRIPIGMIVLEWLDPEPEPGHEDVDWTELESWVLRQYIPRLNHLIQSKAD